MGLYDTAAWKVLRERQLQLEPLCAYCRQEGRRTPAQVVDHIQPHRRDPGLFFDQWNLQSLCKTHHDGAKQSLEKTGRMRGSDATGMPHDVTHPWFSEDFDE